MEHFFERLFRFNRIQIDNLSPHSLERYQDARSSNLRRLQVGTVFNFACIFLGIRAGMPSALLWMILAGISFAISCRAFYGYMLNNVRIKKLSHHQEPIRSDLSSSTLATNLFILQIILILIMPFAIANPAIPLLKILPAIATDTPTASPTLKPSAYLTPTNTTIPTATYTAMPSPTSSPTGIPYVIYYVDSPRPIALRDCPAMDCKIVSTIASGYEIHVTDIGDSWFQIQLEDSRLVYIPSIVIKPMRATPLPLGNSSP